MGRTRAGTEREVWRTRGQTRRGWLLLCCVAENLFCTPLRSVSALPREEGRVPVLPTLSHEEPEAGACCDLSQLPWQVLVDVARSPFWTPTSALLRGLE